MADICMSTSKIFLNLSKEELSDLKLSVAYSIYDHGKKHMQPLLDTLSSIDTTQWDKYK